MTDTPIDPHDELDAQTREAVRALIREEIAHGEGSRRDVLKMAGTGVIGSLLGAGGINALADPGAADASTSDSDGDLGDPTNRFDAWVDGLDANDVTAGTTFTDPAGVEHTGELADASDVGGSSDGPFIDVTNSPYNAPADGSSNARPAIQSAIDDAAAQGGGAVYLPAGTYLVSGSTQDADEIQVKSDVTLLGDGPGATVLRRAASSPIDVIRNASAQDETTAADSNIVIRNLSIDGNQANQTYNKFDYPEDQWLAGVRLRNVDSSLVENVYSYDNTGYAVEFKFATDSAIQDCWGSGNGDDGFSISDNRSGGRSLTRRVTVSNCFAWSNFRQATRDTGSIQVGSGFEVDDGPANVTFQNCFSYDNLVGFDVHTHAGTSEVEPENISFVNCWSYEDGRENAEAGFLIGEYGGAQDVTIRGGGVIRHGANGVILTDMEDVTVSDLRIVGVGNHGITTRNQDQLPSHIRIQSTDIIEAGGHGVDIGQTRHTLVRDCLIRDAGQDGILVNDGSNNTKGGIIRVEDNYIHRPSQNSDGTYAGINIQNLEWAAVDGNTVREGTLSAQPGAGIEIGAGATNTQLFGNDLAFAGQSNLSDSGTQTTTLWNRGISDAMGVEPDPTVTSLYLDDGANTGGQVAWRYHDGSTWQTLSSGGATNIAASGTASLSNGSATVDTGISSDTTATFMLALGPTTDDAEVAGDIEAQSGGNYVVNIEETDTSVGTLTVEYDVVRVR